MKTNQEHSQEINKQSGIGLVYILVAVALFGALSFMLVRSVDTGETAVLTPERTELYTSQLINYAAQSKSVIDQMLFSGSEVDDLDFSLPGEAAFTAGTQADRRHHVFHPDGGGLNPGKFATEITLSGTDPTSGWYMGRLSNVEWTTSTDTDVMVAAFRIPQQICESINEKITGSTTIPALNLILPKNVFVNDDYHTGTNIDFDISDCTACEGYSSLCVSDPSVATYVFYNLVAER